MKVSIITPTYNDSSTISETIESIYNQNYDNWEWIVINDGSTDDTEDVIKKKLAELGIEDKCTYIYQKNADQLNAVIAGIEYITGEYVFVLHSDDLLPDDEFLERCVAYMKDHDEIDGIFGDLVLIDSKNTIIGSQYIRKYEKTENNNALLLLWLGRNLYSDVAFHKTSSYITAVKYNYLNWNMPLWIDFRNGIVSNLNYSSVDWPLLKYRIHEGNYINNRLGKMNVINGEIRTAIELMKFYEIPFYKLQYIIFRILNKIKKNIKLRWCRMLEAILTEVQNRMEKSLESTKEKFSHVRAGRASVSMLDGVTVEAYGSPTPLNQVGTVSAPEARLLTIDPWDKSLIPAIEKSILQANLGFNPSNDGKVIRLAVPELTEDRRKEYVKLVKKEAEEGKIAIRNVRKDINNKLRKLEKDSEITEDELKSSEEKVQKMTDKFVAAVDEALAKKEKELLKV